MDVLTVITEPDRGFAKSVEAVRAGSSRTDVEYEWI